MLADSEVKYLVYIPCVFYVFFKQFECNILSTYQDTAKTTYPSQTLFQVFGTWYWHQETLSEISIIIKEWYMT